MPSGYGDVVRSVRSVATRRVFWFRFQLVPRSYSLPDMPPNARFRDFATLEAPLKVPFGSGDPDSPSETFSTRPVDRRNRELPARRIGVAVIKNVFPGKRCVNLLGWRILILIDSLRPSADGRMRVFNRETDPFTAHCATYSYLHMQHDNCMPERSSVQSKTI